jgi:uncharacterized protein YecT (DUF1311 family)
MPFDRLKRLEFIPLLGDAVATATMKCIPLCEEDDQNVSKSEFKVTNRPCLQSCTIHLVALAYFLGTSIATAENHRELSQEYFTCLDKANGVTFAMIDCIVAETSRQDTRLNENYKSLTSKVSPKRKQPLLDAQRAWIRFRDANCKFYGDPAGGTSARLSANECLLNITADRAEELKLLIPD